MDWEPITRSELDEMIESELADCSQSLREFFAGVRINPAKWRLTPWGDLGGGFWAVACEERRVLWSAVVLSSASCFPASPSRSSAMSAPPTVLAFASVIAATAGCGAMALLR